MEGGGYSRRWVGKAGKAYQNQKSYHVLTHYSWAHIKFSFLCGLPGTQLSISFLFWFLCSHIYIYNPLFPSVFQLAILCVRLSMHILGVLCGKDMLHYLGINTIYFLFSGASEVDSICYIYWIPPRETIALIDCDDCWLLRVLLCRLG